jgi:hypothetical protein
MVKNLRVICGQSKAAHNPAVIGAFLTVAHTDFRPGLSRRNAGLLEFLGAYNKTTVVPY